MPRRAPVLLGLATGVCTMSATPSDPSSTPMSRPSSQAMANSPGVLVGTLQEEAETSSISPQVEAAATSSSAPLSPSHAVR